jgi:hypothetical protein
MRLTLTVALPTSGQRTSVIVEAGRATTVSGSLTLPTC